MGKRKAKSNNELELITNTSTNDDIKDMSNVIKETEINELTIKKEKRGKYEKPLSNTGIENKYGSEIKKGNYGTLKQYSEQKPNWVELRKQKKELKAKYKAKKFNDIYDMLVIVKQYGEKLRRSNCSEKERKRLILKAHELLTNNYSKVVLTHDMSRIVQWVFKYSDPKIRQDIFNELQPLLLSMIESKYAKNCIKIMLKYGSPEIRSNIVSSCYGNVVRLMSHSVSVPILKLIYSESTDLEKICLKQEFYGDMYKMAKDKDVKTLSDVFKTAKDMKSATLTAVKGNLMRILNKGLLHCPLIHCVLLEFLNHCSNEDRTEIIVMLRNFISELSESKSGSKVAVMCIWNGTNKDRKIIMKFLKDHVKKVSMSEHGYIILLALFDSVDDTVLLNKLILSEIQAELTEIALNEYGKHVILYLVARRDSHHFPPSIVKYLEQGDNNATSKKPANVREKELLDSIRDSLFEAIITNTAVWMSNSSIAMVTLAILKVGTGEKLIQAFNSIAAFVTDKKSSITEKDSKYKPIEHPGIHMMLKKLIQNDKELQKEGESTFGEILIDHLENKTIEKWIKYNRGCFVLILLLENEAPSTVNTLVSKLKPIVNILESKSNPGAIILLKKLK